MGALPGAAALPHCPGVRERRDPSLSTGTQLCSDPDSKPTLCTFPG